MLLATEMFPVLKRKLWGKDQGKGILEPGKIDYDQVVSTQPCISAKVAYVIQMMISTELLFLFYISSLDDLSQKKEKRFCFSPDH